MTLLQDGQWIGNTYQVERFLGEGAFAEVYRVRHRFLGRQAMKVFKATGLTLPEIETMLEEAVLLSQIGHPNIIRVFDANITEAPTGMLGYFTMEYIAGGSLDQFWRSFGNKRIPIETAVEVLRQACRGLSVAHAEQPPIIHRDIKPQNMLVGYDPGGLRVRISDFGLAKRVNPLTLLASARGTRCFKSPEALRDFQADSCAGDVWALGSTLYLLTGDRLPYTDPAGRGLEDMPDYNRPLLQPSLLNYQVDPRLEQIIVRCLAIRPQERYPTARELLADLEAWRPATAPVRLPAYEQPSSKAALGPAASPNQSSAESMARRAMTLAQSAAGLGEAADLMEEAFNLWPALRSQYEYNVRLWRRGIMS